LDTYETEVLIDEMLESHNSESNPLIPILQKIQKSKGYLSMEALRLVSEKTGMSPSRVYGVATFYHQFRLKPEGKHRISICKGTACHVSGVEDIYKSLLKVLEITPPEDTSKDGLFTIQEVRCLGACSLAPVIKIDDIVFGKMNTQKLQTLLKRYKEE